MWDQSSQVSGYLEAMYEPNLKNVPFNILNFIIKSKLIIHENGKSYYHGLFKGFTHGADIWMYSMQHLHFTVTAFGRHFYPGQLTSLLSIHNLDSTISLS